MKLEFEISRNIVDDLDIGDKFWDLNDVDDYFYNCYLKITDKGKKVATMTLTLFDEIKIMNDHRDIIDIADSESQELYDAIVTYKNCKLDKEEREDVIWETNHLCYIDTLYIYPGFRQRCIAKYLLSNLPQILKYCVNASIRASIITPTPLSPNKENSWVGLEEGAEEMKQLMIKVIKKLGYKKIGKRDGNIYAKNHYWEI